MGVVVAAVAEEAEEAGECRRAWVVVYQLVLAPYGWAGRRLLEARLLLQLLLPQRRKLADRLLLHQARHHRLRRSSV